MLVFLDESFRTHERTATRFGVLAGIGIPEDLLGQFQQDWYGVCKPYLGQVLQEGDDVHGKLLLNSTTFRVRAAHRASAHWSLAEDILNYAHSLRLRVFGVVCFRNEFHSFICADETRLDHTFRYLFERIDLYMRTIFPRRFAKIIFDDRGHATNCRNGRAATNFFVRSAAGRGFDTIIKTPLFGVSKANNHGLQLADLITTVVAMKFQGRQEIDPLWHVVKQMLHHVHLGELRQSSLKVLRNPPKQKDPATVRSMAGEIAQHRVSQESSSPGSKEST